jgi:hypothetical protein
MIKKSTTYEKQRVDWPIGGVVIGRDGGASYRRFLALKDSFVFPGPH